MLGSVCEEQNPIPEEAFRSVQENDANTHMHCRGCLGLGFPQRRLCVQWFLGEVTPGYVLREGECE